MMITVCRCGTCSFYDDEMCTLEKGKPIGTAEDDWCLGWREKEDDAGRDSGDHTDHL